MKDKKGKKVKKKGQQREENDDKMEWIASWLGCYLFLLYGFFVVYEV